MKDAEKKGNKPGAHLPSQADAEQVVYQHACRLYTSNDLDGAVRLLREVIHTNPYHADALSLMGTILARGKQFKLAAGLLERVLTIDPRHFDALNNLGNVYRDLGRREEAAECYKKALDVQPSPDTRFNLGILYKELDRTEEAKALFARVLEEKPGDAKTLSEICPLFYHDGDIELVRSKYQKLYELNPTAATLASLKLLLPVLLPDTKEEVLAVRRAYEKALDELLTMDIVLNDPARDVFRTSFFLAYHGEDDRPLLEKLARFYLKGAPSLVQTAPHCQRPTAPKAKLKIGIVSHFFNGGHPVAMCYSRVIERLAADPAFEVHLLTTSPKPPDSTALALASRCAGFYRIPPSVPQARSILAQLEFDILFYTEVGMDGITYFLPFSRLAPIQCMLAGHPDTSGLPNMDYYFINHHYEPEGEEGQSHYSETLVRLEHLPFQAIKPPVPQSFRSRKELGLPEGKNLYLCPMKMHKFHPDFDRAIGAILERDPDGVVVLFKDQGRLTELLQERLARNIPATHERILYVPWASREDFPHYLNAGDVILDPFHFGGGSTLLFVLAIGTPVVAWPSEFLRGRSAQAVNRYLGIEGLSAASQEDFPELAVTLARDKPRLAALREEIRAKADAKFYDNPAGSLEICEKLKSLGRKHGILA